eukprot:1604103-Rhodomonas_salina.5
MSGTDTPYRAESGYGTKADFCHGTKAGFWYAVRGSEEGCCGTRGRGTEEGSCGTEEGRCGSRGREQAVRPLPRDHRV